MKAAAEEADQLLFRSESQAWVRGAWVRRSEPRRILPAAEEPFLAGEGNVAGDVGERGFQVGRRGERR